VRGTSQDVLVLFHLGKFTVNGRSYRILAVIGQGGEATVYECEDDDGHLHAAKVFYFSRFPPSQLRYRVDGFLKEARILRYLSGRSPHFVYLHDYEFKPSENVGYMIMELGSSCLRQHMQGLPVPDQTRQMFWGQIVGILRALEDAQIGNRTKRTVLLYPNTFACLFLFFQCMLISNQIISLSSIISSKSPI
jgi:serine/threonine protein kinase